jgi:hypothetical protein
VVQKFRSQFLELASVRPSHLISYRSVRRAFSGSVIPQPPAAAGGAAGGGGRGPWPSHEGRALPAGVPGRG